MNKLRKEEENKKNVSKNLNQKDLKYSSEESDEGQEETQFDQSAFLKNDVTLKSSGQKRYLKTTKIEPSMKSMKAKTQNNNNFCFYFLF